MRFCPDGNGVGHRQRGTATEGASTDIAIIRERLQEYQRLRGDRWSGEGELAEAALFVEDVFGILLTDEEISEESLGSLPQMEALVTRRLKLLREGE